MEWLKKLFKKKPKDTTQEELLRQLLREQHMTNNFLNLIRIEIEKINQRKK